MVLKVRRPLLNWVNALWWGACTTARRVAGCARPNGNTAGVIMEIGADLDLDVTLHRIITAAIERTGAGYGALGVRGPNGTLTSFLHAGMVHMYALAAGRTSHNSLPSTRTNRSNWR